MTAAPQSFREALGVAWNRHKGRFAMAAVGSLTLGLAPFYPHAHVWKQLVSLFHGTLTERMDQFDLVLHGAPWLALVAVGLHILISASVLREPL